MGGSVTGGGGGVVTSCVFIFRTETPGMKIKWQKIYECKLIVNANTYTHYYTALHVNLKDGCMYSYTYMYICMCTLNYVICTHNCKCSCTCKDNRCK